MQKNFWIINQYAGSPVHGMEFRHYYFARELVRRGHQVTIFSGSASHLHSQQPQTKGLVTQEMIDGIRYLWIKLPSYQNSASIGRIWNMWMFFLRLLVYKPRAEKPDYLLVSSPSLFPSLIGWLWSRRYKIRWGFEVRDIWPLSLSVLSGRPMSHPLFRLMSWFEKIGYSKADHLFSVLPLAWKHFQKIAQESKNKFCYLPNGVDLEELSRSIPLDDRTARQFPNGQFVVGYAGTLGIANALEYLIDAAAILQEHSDIKFVLLGDGGQKIALVKAAEKLHNVVFIDRVAKTQIPAVLARFDLCYIGWRRDSLYEYGISANKLFDYLYSAKPIIHSVEAGNDPVQEAQAGVSILPENPQAIADAILELKSLSHDDRSRMGNNGRQFILDNHTYKVIVDRFLETKEEMS